MLTTASHLRCSCGSSLIKLPDGKIKCYECKALKSDIFGIVKRINSYGLTNPWVQYELIKSELLYSDDIDVTFWSNLNTEG